MFTPVRLNYCTEQLMQCSEANPLAAGENLANTLPLFLLQRKIPLTVRSGAQIANDVNRIFDFGILKKVLLIL